MIWICATCAVETDDLTEPPAECGICTDERQWVPATGQAWTTLETLRTKGTRIAIHAVSRGSGACGPTRRSGSVSRR